MLIELIVAVIKFASIRQQAFIFFVSLRMRQLSVDFAKRVFYTLKPLLGRRRALSRRPIAADAIQAFRGEPAGGKEEFEAAEYEGHAKYII